MLPTERDFTMVLGRRYFSGAYSCYLPLSTDLFIRWFYRGDPLKRMAINFQALSTGHALFQTHVIRKEAICFYICNYFRRCSIIPSYLPLEVKKYRMTPISGRSVYSITAAFTAVSLLFSLGVLSVEICFREEIKIPRYDNTIWYSVRLE